MVRVRFIALTILEKIKYKAPSSVSGKWQTGKIDHNWVLAADLYDQEEKGAYAYDFGNQLATNLATQPTTLIPFTSNLWWKFRRPQINQ